MRKAIIGSATLSILAWSTLLSFFTCNPKALGADCIAPFPGLEGWWPADGDGADITGGNSGALSNGVVFVPGMVGQAMRFNGTNSFVEVPDAPSLRMTNEVTIEFWVKRLRLDSVLADYIIEKGGDWTGAEDNYGVALHVAAWNFCLHFTFKGGWRGAGRIDDLEWHHCAVVARHGQTDPEFYIDGVPQPVLYREGASTVNLHPSTRPLHIGAQVDPVTGWRYYGKTDVDELGLYSRALGAEEIQAIFLAGAAGKCRTPVPPQIHLQPLDQTAGVGDDVIFKVGAGGTPPLSYQWFRDGNALPGRTASTLVLPAVTVSEAGVYSVVVSNLSGWVFSSNATLAVGPQPTQLADDFEPDLDPYVWSGFSGTVVAAQYGGAVSGTNSLWFGGNGSRIATTRPMDTSLGGWVEFNLRLGQGRAGNWETPELPGEGVVLECSPGASGEWIELARFDSPNYFDWTRLTIMLPDTGLAERAQFRWRQLSNSGDGLDNWALDDVLIVCVPTPPLIGTQPRDVMVEAGQTAVFSVEALGSTPLTFQWLFNGTGISGATESSLILTNAQFPQAGTYSVVVSNSFGSVQSENALLAVHAPPPCAMPTAGMAAWWPADSDAADIVGGNNGRLSNGVGLVTGKVSQAMRFNGSNSFVEVPDSPVLRITNELTVEFWVKRLRLDSADYIVEKGGDWTGSADNYGVALHVAAWNYCLHFTFKGGWRGAGRIDDLEWHHCAVVARHGQPDPEFYIDGVQQTVLYRQGASTLNLFASSRPLHIGAQVDPVKGINYYSKTDVDELAIYNRALAANEIQGIYQAGSAGKCRVAIPPSIASQPARQSVLAGSDVTFTVVAAGTAPLNFQWQFNGVDVAGATDSFLTLADVQIGQAGTYSVVVSNSAGTAVSADAELTVALPPALVQMRGTDVAAGGVVDMPVEIAANGNENAIGFSLGFDPTRLTYAGIHLGADVSGAMLLVNTNEAANGRLGVAIALAPETAMLPGTRQLVRVLYVAALVPTATTTGITFADAPIGRQLADVPGNSLPAVYQGGTVNIAAAQYEADVLPRPNGNQDVQITDWVMLGRYAARTEYPTNATEFQRADCAPRSTSGDGMIKVTDWVQAGRYAARLDPLTPLGGPDTEILAGFRPTPEADSPPQPGPGIREVRVSPGCLVQGQSGALSVILEAQGDENALGFSVTFDAEFLRFLGARTGSDAQGASLIVNSSQAASGRLGFAVALSTGSNFAPGTRELLSLDFEPMVADVHQLEVGFGDQPVPREVSNPGAQSLPAGYSPGTVSVNPPPKLGIRHSGSEVLLSWPLWATNFTLQESSGGLAGWGPSPAPVQVGSNGHTAAVPATESVRFYRLYRE